jgi:hypothetical protein
MKASIAPVLIMSVLGLSFAASVSAEPTTKAVSAVDQEAAEIERLTSISIDKGRVTNTATWEQAQALKAARVKRYREALHRDKDPVAVAARWATDKAVESHESLDFLADHLDDPRSEQALATVAQSEPQFLSDGLITRAGYAEKILTELWVRRQFADIVGQAQGIPERTAAIITFLHKRPDLMEPIPSSATNAFLADRLFQELAKSDDTNAVRLIFESGHITRSYATNHFQQMLVYARSLTPEQGVSNPPLVERLSESGDPAVIPILEQWMPHAKTDGQKDYFKSALRDLRNPPRTRP